MADFLTAGDLALYEQRKYGNGYGWDGGYGHHDRKRASGTAIAAVAIAGAAGAAVIAVAACMNAASKARSRGNERAIDILAQQALQEQQSREAWQSKHSPSTVQYVDVQTGAGAFSNANAAAAALAYQNQNFGLNSAIGGCNFLRVARYSAPQPCGCDAE
jgi:LmbE family N-acetylglucosaminyl deacetylase